jgi:hypothetical protein
MSDDSVSRRPDVAGDSCSAAVPAAEACEAVIDAGETPALQVVVVEETLSSGRRSRHRMMLVVASIAVVLSLLFNVRDDQRVEIRWLPGIPMPEMCWSRSVFGVKCPGCGLTRSIVYLAHGDWRASWKMHRVGFAMALAILAQFPYCIVGLRYKKDYPLGHRFVSIVAWALIVLLIGNWLYDIFTSAA